MVRAGFIFVTCLIVGVMINLFSPSVTLILDSDERLTFWLTLCLIGGMGIFFCDVILNNFAQQLPGIIKAIAQSIAGSIAVLIPVFTIYEAEDLPGPENTVIIVWAVMVLIVAGSAILRSQSHDNKNEVGDIERKAALPVTDNAVPKILSRLPVHFQNAELYALSAENHYVRVHTSQGEEMLLMRLSDAIMETDHVTGTQTHRSWWVAKAAINSIRLKGRTAEISLKNETSIPVSRTALKTLKNAGWL